MNHYGVSYDSIGELTLCYLTAEVMWESSDWWLIQSQPRRVLPVASLKLGLSLTVLNAVLWLIAIVLQALLLKEIDCHFEPSSYTLVGICLGWSATNMVTTAGSLYGLIRNTEKDVKSYLVLTAMTAAFSPIIFFAYVVALCLDTATESWLEPGGFSIFTGLYVSGESCIMLWYFSREWKAHRIEVEEEKMDRIQQRVREQQNHHLSVLTNTVQPTPPSAYGVKQMMGTTETQVEVMQEGMGVEDVSDAGSDRLTYYPPVFV
ncbi:uncharacterized protein LOC116928957 [Daphnia magna]|uniref:Transmembrane protein n=1 Tax=Daphnia magna TaxID=35525 RepID=A0ABR0B2T3_9CRUS|nr:uncharacterized protein LOC116928957 [Daphnia magna]KAK4036009.1 hypothetical protein OUZ56_028081 [Daphnia magna]